LIVLMEPLADGKAEYQVDDKTFRLYLQWSTRGLSGGPVVVAENLLQELKSRTDIAWSLVTPESNFERKYSVMWVVNNLKDLVWASENKARLGCQYLWAGPNLVVVPQEGQEIIGHRQIDRVVVPCQWVGEVYSYLMPTIKEKLMVWPVGIDAEFWRPNTTSEKQLIVVYDKGNPELAEKIDSGLCSFGEKTVKITYGNYRKNEYKDLLEQAKAMVWLSATESQGIALMEALAMNIPVLCLKNNVWNYQSFELQTGFRYDGATSAPYFNEQCGMFFEDGQDFFQKQYPAFSRNIASFTPRAYLYENNLVIGKSLTCIREELNHISYQ